MRKIIFIILFSICTFVLAEAQSIHVSGRITDNSGSALDLVHIRLSKGSIGTLSNYKGEYELLVPKSDSLHIIFTSLGYKRVERVISTNLSEKDDRKVILNVQMLPNTAVIDDVEVVANKRRANSFEGIETTNIKTMPSTSGNSVEDALSTLAGVTMNNEMSSQYSVRGGSFDENLIYVNGIEIYRPQLIRSGQQEGLSFINSSMVGSIQFSTGGFSSEYGDKMSSVLDISYKSPEEFESQIDANFMGASASIGHKNKHFSQLHGLRYRRNASLLATLDFKGDYDPKFFDYQTLLRHEINGNTEVSFLGNISANHYKFTPSTRETTFGTFNDVRKFKVYFDGKEKDQFDTYFGALSIKFKGLKNTDLQFIASAFSTKEEVTYDISGEYWLDAATNDGQGSLGVGAYHEHARNNLKASVLSASFKGSTQISHNKISYGVNTQKEIIDDRIAEWERRDSSGYTLPHIENEVNMISNLHSAYNKQTVRISSFIQDNFGWNAIGGRFYLIAGLRFSHWSFNKENLLSPRAILTFTPDRNNKLTLRLASGIYYQSPFYKEYREVYNDKNGNSMVNMNSSIKSQKSVQLVFGSDYIFEAYNRPFKFTAEVYHKNISNYIPYTIDNVQIRYLGHNEGKAYTSGIDMKLFGEFVDGTDSWISLSLMQSKEDYNGLKTSRPTEQRYSLGMYFSDYWPGNDSYKVFLRGIINDGLPIYSPLGGRESGIFRTPTYKRIDLGASRVFDKENCNLLNRGQWKNIKEISVGLQIFNLMDFDNVNSYYWVTSVDNIQHAVPNYLSKRMFSLNIGIKL